jgi:NAD(P)-dependent dehydrogenase (short-subunit alcohol dehydrogenase family)
VDFDDDAGHAAADDLDGLFVHADVGEAGDVDAAFAECERELGGIDIAYLNAGIAIGHVDLETLPDELYRRIMRVNVDGVVYGVRAAIPALERRGGGAIVATASLAGLIPFPADPVYDLTKHAVVGLIRSVAPTLAPRNITANTVNPGMTDTNIITDDVKTLLAAASFPLMPADQIADAVLGIVASGVTGECWVCQPGRAAEAYRFHQVPGPRVAGAEGRVPPGVGGGRSAAELRDAAG